MNNRTYNLAFDTGIGGGSVSVFDGHNILGCRVNNLIETKADFLVRNISELLEDLKIGKEGIGNIYFSDSPGSQTALKIGFATAKGIKTALGAILHQSDMFLSIANYLKNCCRNSILILLPISQTNLEWKLFDEKNELVSSGLIKSEELLMADNFSEKLADHFRENDGQYIDLFAPFEIIYKSQKIDFSEYQNHINIRDLGKNLSQYLIVRA